MKAVITGGAGFIGSHVVDKMLGSGIEVVVLDNYSTGRKANLDHCIEKVRIVECDISETGDWQKEFVNVDFVVHLAALADIVPSIQRPVDYYAANVTGTINVLEAARAYGVEKLIYSASSSCYGLSTIFPTPEGASIVPEYPYALTKRLGEELVLHWSKVYGINAISLRFFNVYGPRSRTSGTYGAMFGVFLAQKLAGAPLTIVGDGSQTRDFTYVCDVAEAVYLACHCAQSGLSMNIGSGKAVSINYIASLLGGKLVNIPKRPGEPDCTEADTSLAKQVLGWKPKVSIEEGVEILIENIDYWKDATVWTPDLIFEATADWFRLLGKNA